MANTPEIEEYITSDGWSLTCQAPDCNWTDYVTERTENWMEEMHETIDQHKQWHEDGMPPVGALVQWVGDAVESDQRTPFREPWTKPVPEIAATPTVHQHVGMCDGQCGAGEAL